MKITIIDLLQATDDEFRNQRQALSLLVSHHRILRQELITQRDEHQRLVKKLINTLEGNDTQKPTKQNKAPGTHYGRRKKRPGTDEKISGKRATARTGGLRDKKNTNSIPD